MKAKAISAILSSMAILCFATTYSQAQNTVGGLILEDVTWTFAGSPYIIVNDLTIEQGGSLLIEPGVEVRFEPMAKGSGYDQAKAELIVRGSLRVLGSSSLEKDVLLTSNAERPLPGDWAGIRFERGGRGELQYATIEYADQGVCCYFTEDVILEGNAIRYCTYSGISVHNSSAEITSNLITDNRGHGLLASSATLLVQGNLIADNEGHGISWSNSDKKHSAISGNTINYNGLCGLYLYHFYGLVQGNYIADNGRNGISVVQSECEVTNNQVSDNANTAVFSYHSKPWIEHNQLTHNRVGIEARHQSEIQAHANNIYENTDYNALMSAALRAKVTGSVLLADNNWWGGLDAQQASGTMLGFFLGPIQFLPLSTSQFPFSLARFYQSEAPPEKAEE